MLNLHRKPRDAEDPEAVIRPTLDDLIRLNQPAKSIELARSTARALQSGQYFSAFKGRGMEFDESRPYAHGDDIRSLDWRVTARTGKVHTKLFREERERPVFLSVDLRAPMFFATRGMFKSVLASRLAALIAWSACHHGDRIGGQIFSEAGSTEYKPLEGHSAVLRILKGLAEQAQAPKPQSHQHHALDQAFNELNRHIKPGSLAFIISDFRDLGAAGASNLGRLARQSTVVLIMISDPIERDLPQGLHRYGGPEEDRMILGDEKSRRLHLEKFEARENEIRKLARGHRMRFVSGWTNEEPVLILERAFRSKTF
jgi:uncharacterized protein (DUF58 family)